MSKSFNALQELIQLCLVTTCNVDGKEPTTAEKRRMKSLHKRSIRLLCLVELQAPQTFFAKYIHEMSHVIDCIARWGSARNFWSFFPERFVGWITNFIKARFSPSASLVNGYSRFTFMRRIAPELRAKLLDVSATEDMKMGDFLKAYDREYNSGNQGSGTIKVQAGWRNAKKFTTRYTIMATAEYGAVKNYISTQFRAHGSLFPTQLRVLKGGVYINHAKRQWKTGTPCLYNTGEGESCGIIVSMLQWDNEVESYYLFCIQPHKLEAISLLRVKSPKEHYQLAPCG